MKTDHEINEAIAEKCGWREAFPRDKPAHPETKKGGILLPYNWVNEITHKREIHLPNYCSDLNAMHEARLSLNCLQQNRFSYELMRVLGINSDQISEACVLFEFANATARQRAEAFCRTVGIEFD